MTKRRSVPPDRLSSKQELSMRDIKIVADVTTVDGAAAPR
jgi:hypothetical protein